jgi:two-component system, sensor histidine kinase RegB
LRGLFFGDAVTVITTLTQITQVRLINLRWLSISAMSLAGLISPQLLGSFDLMPRLLALATLVAGINACLRLAIAFNRGGRAELPMLSPLIQLGFDLTVWAVYIYLSGGATNPLISVFMPLVAIGAIVLNQAQAWGLGLGAILAYSFLWRFYQPLSIRNAQTASQLHLSGMWLVFVVSAIVVIWFILQMTAAVRQRDAALAEAREQAIRNDWLISMGSLAAGAAHELSTPLATLTVLVDEMLGERALPKPLRRDAALMRRQLDTCKQALTRLTQRAGHPRGSQDADVAAGPWLKSLLDAWLALNPATGVCPEIARELDTRQVPLDLSIERALTNLLDNARSAGASLIVLNGSIEAEHLAVSVRDDGAGISADALTSFAAGRPIVSEHGMGIGLLLARTAIERRGGALEIWRIADRGSYARLRLPLTKFQEARHEP